jgi:hypothetical protein
VHTGGLSCPFLLGSQADPSHCVAPVQFEKNIKACKNRQGNIADMKRSRIKTFLREIQYGIIPKDKISYSVSTKLIGAIGYV